MCVFCMMYNMMSVFEEKEKPGNRVIVPSVPTRLRSRVRKKSKNLVDEEVVNLAEHLAKQKLFEISN